MPEGIFLDDVHEWLNDIDPLAVVSRFAVIGSPGEWHGKESRFPAVIEPYVVAREFARVHAGCDRPTIVGSGSLLMAGSHIGHDSQLGKNCDVAPNAVIGGCVTIGDRVKIGMGAVIRPWVTIGDNATIGAGAVVTKDVPANETWAGNPARLLHKWKPENV